MVEELEDILDFVLLAYAVDIYVKLKHFECRMNHIIIVFFKLHTFFILFDSLTLKMLNLEYFCKGALSN